MPKLLFLRVALRHIWLLHLFILSVTFIDLLQVGFTAATWINFGLVALNAFELRSSYRREKLRFIGLFRLVEQNDIQQWKTKDTPRKNINELSVLTMNCYLKAVEDFEKHYEQDRSRQSIEMFTSVLIIFFTISWLLKYL
ncbi:hypothetical protein [Selenomonas sp. WCT3]|uniref:hypothetical protein n=1 Tax=Selenomonas sp. WCT3 TaxID=3158785 RepID=UPI0009421EB3